MSICGGVSSTPAIGRAATTAITQVVLNLSFACVRATTVPATRRLEYLQGIAFPALVVENRILAAMPKGAKVKPPIWTCYRVSSLFLGRTSYVQLTFS